MNLPRVGRVVPAVVAVVLVTLVGGGVALSAAPPTNPLKPVLAKLNTIIEMLTPTAGPVTLSISAVFLPESQGANCTGIERGDRACAGERFWSLTTVQTRYLDPPLTWVWSQDKR